MSVVATNPNRTAFYGSEAFLSRAVMSSESVHSVVGLGLGHATHESVSSINTMSSLNSVDYGSEAEADEAEAVYTANLVAFKACGPAKYIRREDGNDVGVAF
jgi:hypothetical protein